MCWWAVGRRSKSLFCRATARVIEFRRMRLITEPTSGRCSRLGREHSFFDGADGEVRHVDFSRPYSTALRDCLKQAGAQLGYPVVAAGTYGSTNGPRFETAAEIRRMQRDGCSIVGMTGMPEAALARELGIDYACLALVVNWAAGVDDSEISMPEIMVNLEQGIEQVRPLLLAAARNMG
jgi:purine nucleoside phosphorylase